MAPPAQGRPRNAMPPWCVGRFWGTALPAAPTIAGPCSPPHRRAGHTDHARAQAAAPADHAAPWPPGLETRRQPQESAWESGPTRARHPPRSCEGWELPPWLRTPDGARTASASVHAAPVRPVRHPDRCRGSRLTPGLGGTGVAAMTQGERCMGHGGRAWSAFSLRHVRQQSYAQQPNARLQAPPRAGARHERRLLAVACKPWLGAGWTTDPVLARRSACLVAKPWGAAHALGTRGARRRRQGPPDVPAASGAPSA